MGKDPLPDGRRVLSPLPIRFLEMGFRENKYDREVSLRVLLPSVGDRSRPAQGGWNPLPFLVEALLEHKQNERAGPAFGD